MLCAISWLIAFAAYVFSRILLRFKSKKAEKNVRNVIEKDKALIDSWLYRSEFTAGLSSNSAP